jgi:hypothetical protein
LRDAGLITPVQVGRVRRYRAVLGRDDYLAALITAALDQAKDPAAVFARGPAHPIQPVTRCARLHSVLRACADAGDGDAATRLARLLADRGDLDELRARADAGDGIAASALPSLLTQQGHGNEGERLRRFGLNPDRSIASA